MRFMDYSLLIGIRRMNGRTSEKLEESMDLENPQVS